MLQYSGWHGTINKRFYLLVFLMRNINLVFINRDIRTTWVMVFTFFLPFDKDTGKTIASAHVAKYKSFELSKPGVRSELIHAKIILSSMNNIFMLDDPANQSLLEEYRQAAFIQIEREITDIADSGAKNRATLLNQNQGLIIELLLDLASQHGKNYEAVQSKTYTDIPFLPVINGKNGEEICIRDLNCMTNIL